MKIKRLLSLLVCAALLLTLAPTTASALDMQKGLPMFAVNSASPPVVSFGGKQWVVIGYNGTGVASSPDTLTLLLAGSETPVTTLYDSSCTSNQYGGSTLQTVMDAQFAMLGDGEKAVICGRTLMGGGVYPTPGDNISGSDVLDAKFWPLSVDEASAVNSTLRTTSYNWWLRSPGYWDLTASVVFDSGLVHGFGASVVLFNYGARPAFQLDLSSVLFTSAASGTSAKSSVTAGSGLVAASATYDAVKFTMQSASQALTVNATTAQSTQSASTLGFSYANATAGANQFVSCVLENGSGDVKYYGKLADSSSAASGSLSIPLSGVADGTYTLNIFSEEANGDNYTDFCSEPVTMTVTVSGGTGTVSGFGGTVLVLSDNAGLASVAGQAVTATGTGTSASPKTAAVSVANSVSSVTLADIVAATDAGKHIYSNSGFTANEDAAIALSPGANHVYVKVTAEDTTTTLYYDVTVNRAVVITGLPTTYTMYENGRVTWEPQPDGGTWDWDHDFFSATFNSPATFTALKAGTSDITYTVGGVSQSVTVTIRKSGLPPTGQDLHGRGCWALWLRCAAARRGDACV